MEDREGNQAMLWEYVCAHRSLEREFIGMVGACLDDLT